MFKTLRQTVTFSATPKAVYALLANAEKHAAMIGAPVSLDNRVGGKLSAWDGSITGINVELVAGKRIVQMWRAGDWPKGHYSTATFEFAPSDNGTTLTFTQTGIPADKYDSIRDGWKEHYWSKMKSALKG